MRNCVKLAVAYIRFYQKQAAVLFLGISMSVLLLTGIASLLYSNQHADYENAKEKYGDWAYRIKTTEESEFETDGGSQRVNGNYQLINKSKNYQLTKAGYFSCESISEEKQELLLCYGDAAYREQTGRNVLEGRYPERAGEIALDYYALHNLEMEDTLGSTLVLGEQSYTLVGILSEGVSEEETPIMVFTVEEAMKEDRQSYYYLAFSEDARAYEQFSAFLRENQIRETEWEMNDGLAAYIGAEPQENIIAVIRTAWQLPEGKLIYLMGTLENSHNLLSKMIVWILFAFSVFIITSILQVILDKRIRQYGMMEVLGMTEKDQYISLWIELILIFFPAYLVGSLAGNGLAAWIYRGGFLVDWHALSVAAAAFVLYLFLLGFVMIRRMQKDTQTEKMKSYSGRLHRNPVSTRTHDLVGVLSRRFLLERKGNFIGIILSLSLGGVLFLCTNYVADNAKRNMMHAMQTDEGLYGDICISIDDDDLGKVIPEQTVASILQNRPEGIQAMFPVSYTLGEIPLENGIFHWTDYYPEVAKDPTPDFVQDPEIMEKYHGIATKQEEGSYRLKVNVYGYGEEQFQDLSDYILDGEIDPEKMLQDNQIILKTLMDGAGYYDGIDIRPGDHITLKVPKTDSLQQEPELLRFQSGDENYMEKDFEVAALVSRCVGENDVFIGSGTNVVSIIMPQQMMEQSLGVHGYNQIRIKINDRDSSEAAVQELRPYLTGISSCRIHDYSGGIKKKNQILMQKVYFFYGISILLFLISLLHAVNSMKHLIWSRRYEFGVLRAMGITDVGFRNMLLKQGAVYGILSSLVMVVLTVLCQGVLAGVMQHVVRYIIVSRNISLVSCIVMALWNSVVCMFAMVFCGRGLLREAVVDEIRG